MNERIQELAVEAGFYANPDVEKFEKFAELIVKECAAEADRCVERGSLMAGYRIKRHFGIDDE